MPTDCFIQGDGFFLVGPKDVDVNNAEDAKALSLSRVGDFRFDSDGYLVDGAGNVVYGFVTCNMDGCLLSTSYRPQAEPDDGSLSQRAGD